MMRKFTLRFVHYKYLPTLYQNYMLWFFRYLLTSCCFEHFLSCLISYNKMVVKEAHCLGSMIKQAYSKRLIRTKTPWYSRSTKGTETSLSTVVNHSKTYNTVYHKQSVQQYNNFSCFALLQLLSVLFIDLLYYYGPYSS